MVIFKKIFPFFFLLLVFKAEAQQIFQKTYHHPTSAASSAKSFVIDSLGNIYIVGGGTSTSTTYSDCLLMKADSNGTLQCTKLFGGTSLETAWQIEFTNDNNLIISAFTTKFNLNPNDYHPMLIKTDTSGNLIWGKVYIDSLECEQDALLKLPDGGFLLSGCTNMDFVNDTVPWLAFMMRLDASGNILWNKTYGADSLDCSLFEAVLMSDGGFLSTGFIYSKTTEEYDIMLLRTDSSGNLQWVKRMILPLWDFAPHILKMHDGNFLLAGYSQDLNTTGTSQVILFKTDSMGNILWTKWYSSLFAGSILDAISPTKDSGFIFSGHGLDNFVKIDSAGNIIFYNDFRITPSNTVFYKIKELPSGGFLLAGQTGSNVNVYIAKIDSTGNAGCYQNNTIPLYSFDTLSYFTPVVLNTYAHSYTVYSFSDTNSVSFSETGWCNTATDIKEQPFAQERDIKIFPNPAEKFIHVIWKNQPDEKYVVKLSDFSGRIISEFTENKGSDLTIEIDELKSGLYFISLTSENISIYKKFLKL